MRSAIQYTAIAICIFSVQVAQAADNSQTFDSTLREIAKRTSLFLKEKKETNIVPQFQGLADYPGGGEAGFQESLSEMLRGHGCRISNNAKYILSARTFRSKSIRNDLALSIRCQILDQYGDVVVSFANDTEVNDGEDVAQMLGINAVFQPTDKGLNRLDDLLKERTKKWAFINEKGWVFSDKSGTYGMQILINNQFQPVRNGHGSERGPSSLALLQRRGCPWIKWV